MEFFMGYAKFPAYVFFGAFGNRYYMLEFFGDPFLHPDKRIPVGPGGP